MNTDYKKLREQVLTELEAKIEEREKLTRRLDDLQQEISGLEAMSAGLDVYLGESTVSDDVTMGITDAIRRVLSFNDQKPTEIRDALRETEFRIDDYSQPMAVIHTTLKRLENQREIESFEKDGVTAYRRPEKDVPF